MKLVSALVMVAAFIMNVHAIERIPRGCSPEVFCGSMKNSGYCSNYQHCYPFNYWYHDAASGKCRKFKYYGRGGNYNRFPTKEACIKTCRAYFKSYSYNKLCKTCPYPVFKRIYWYEVPALFKSGFFCNGDDCKCYAGLKCCRVYYKVFFNDYRKLESRPTKEADITEKKATEEPEEEEEKKSESRRKKRDASPYYVAYMTGYSCLKPIEAPCEDPHDECFDRKARTKKYNYEYSPYNTYKK